MSFGHAVLQNKIKKIFSYLISSKCGASIADTDTDTDTDTLLPIKAIFCQWEQFFWITVSSATEHDTDIHNNMKKQQRKTGQESIPVLYYPSDTDANIRLNILGIWSIRPPLALSSFTTQQIQKFVLFSPYLHSRMYRMAIRYPLFFRHSRIAWTAASEELKVGSEQELSWAALLSSVKEAAADLRLVFNLFSSLDMLVSCERGSGWCESVLQIRWGGVAVV